MKKALTQTIIVFVAVNLITAGFALAQNDPNGASKDETLATQLEVAHKQMEAAQKEMQVAQEQMVVAEKQMMVAMPSIANIRMPVWQQSHSGAVLVIPAAEMKVENLAAITEDMSVMSRIFDNKLSQAHLTTGRASLFVVLAPFSGHNSGTIEAIFLEGYGALFLMKVNVLLSPPPEAQQEKETEEEDTDPLWTQMRQEIYAPEEANRRRRTGERPEEKYDAEKVEELKETLIKTLKHAANIRALKPDESVVLTVIGKAGQPSASAIGRLYREDYSSRYIISTSRAGTGFSSPTVLTIRAKKSDIDAFAEGKLSFDQFTEKTQLLSYSYLSENIGDRPSRSSGIGELGRSTRSTRSTRGSRGRIR